MELPSKNERPADTVYHGTDCHFDRFALDCCLGAHFGTARAATDRLRSTGRLRIEYETYPRRDGRWMVREQNWSNRQSFEHGPFEDEDSAECFILTAPVHRKPLEFEIDVCRPLPLPDLGTWDFHILMHHLDREQLLCDSNAIWRHWNCSSEAGWQALKTDLARQGYDCVCYHNETEDPGSISWIVFDAERIHPKWRPAQPDNEPYFERARMRA